MDCCTVYVVVYVILACLCQRIQTDLKRSFVFYPAEIKVPANKKLRLLIENQDNTPEEFDSFDLNREKVLYPGRTSVIYIGPLSPGRYDFFGEFSPNTARGTVVATEVDNADN